MGGGGGVGRRGKEELPLCPASSAGDGPTKGVSVLEGFDVTAKKLGIPLFSLILMICYLWLRYDDLTPQGTLSITATIDTVMAFSGPGQISSLPTYCRPNTPLLLVASAAMIDSYAYRCGERRSSCLALGPIPLPEPLHSPFIPSHHQFAMKQHQEVPDHRVCYEFFWGMEEGRTGCVFWERTGAAWGLGCSVQ